MSDELAARCKGGRTKVWGFGVVDIARVLGETEECIRTRIYRGTLDPSTLEGLMDALRDQV